MMTAPFKRSQNRAGVQQDKAQPFLCMRLMCSQDQTELDTVINELSKAGIAAETRNHPIAEALGVPGKEVWVPNERDFYNAAKLLARLQAPEPFAEGGEEPAPNAELDINEVFVRHRSVDDVPKPQHSPLVNSGGATWHTEPEPQEIDDASSLLEREIEEMLGRDGELSRECVSLRSKVRELEQALAGQHAAVAMEIKNHQADALLLRRYILALELQREEDDTCLHEARAQLTRERRERLAVQERAQTTALRQQAVQKQLLEHEQLQQKLQSHMASLNALYNKLQAKRTNKAGLEPLQECRKW